MYSEPFKRDWKERETLCGATKMVADEIARDTNANEIANRLHELERQLRELHTREVRS